MPSITPENKDSWFIQWLDEKFDSIHQEIKNLASEAEGQHKLLYSEMERVEAQIEIVDKKHSKNYRNLLKLIALVFIGGSFLWIKESREFLLQLFFRMF